MTVDGAGSDSETVLHRQRDAGGSVFLKLGHRDEDVAVTIRVIQVVAGEEQAAMRDHEPRIRLAAAQEIRILKLYPVRRPFKVARYPSGPDHELLERFGR